MKQLWMCLLPALIYSSCKKDEQSQTHLNQLKLQLVHSFNSNEPVQDSLLFYNAYGDTLSLSRVTYFLSGFKLIGDQSNYSSSDVMLIDLFKSRNTGFDLQGIPDGQYKFLELQFGLDSSLNVFGSIPNTVDNNEMFWPVPMGGGYHFMKLEGHYLDSGHVKGYAVHLGKNGQQFIVRIPVNLKLPELHGVKLNVLLDEWLKNPYSYRFKTDGPYTMSNDAMMHMISENGKDVFELDSIW